MTPSATCNRNDDVLDQTGGQGGQDAASLAEADGNASRNGSARRSLTGETAAGGVCRRPVTPVSFKFGIGSSDEERGGLTMEAGDTRARNPPEVTTPSLTDDELWTRSVAGEPKVRANWLKYTVHCAKHHPTLSQPILAAIPAALRDEIRAPGLLGWLPVRALAELCEAVRTGAGSLGARTFFRQSLHDAIQQPLMKPLAHGAVHLWGRSPLALVRRTPQAWQLVTRSCGEMRCVDATESNAIILRAEFMPPSCRVLGLLHMLEGGLVAQMDWVQFRGAVETRARDFARLGTAEFVIRWSP